MKNCPIHKNLDTSFVNLSALLRYVRQRQFAGHIHVELNGYDADITLTADGQMRVREHDRIAGRIAEGDDALERLLIRAREPGGIINVYQSIGDAAPVTEKLTQAVEENPFASQVEQAVINIVSNTPRQNGNSKNGNSKNGKIELPTTDKILPNEKLPFELSNQMESKARQTSLAPEDWQTLLNLTAELLDTIDKSLAEANLEFAAAFEKARIELSNDYPFLNPANEIFDYENGKITVRKQLNAKLFAASINEALRRILDKLGKNPKFLNVYFTTTQKIIELIEKRKPLYDKYFITPQLERTVGA